MAPPLRLRHRPGVDWGAHQLHTTANVLTNWEMGTLDLQIEHHLFPCISYEHQHSIRTLVKSTAAEFGLPYYEHPSLNAAYGAHWAWLGHMAAGKVEADFIVPDEKSKAE
jgi:linoleoyl-CoA desaturase